MRNTILKIMLFTSSFVFAQTGINTQNPQAILHVDGSNDNPTIGLPSISQQANDFVVTSKGWLGVGTNLPLVPLEINKTKSGAIRIFDGTQGDRKVLTSDVNGICSWRAGSVSSVTGVCPLSSTPYGVTNDKYMEGYIDLPHGRWFVYLGFLVNGATAGNVVYASRLSFSSSSSISDQTSGFNFINNNSTVLKQVSNGPSGHKSFGMFCSGIVRIEVTSESILRLYLWDRNSRIYSSNISSLSLSKNAENYLFAIRAD